MPLRAVLVDDDARFRAMARRVLIADGLDVVAEVDKGAEVEAAVARWRPDMVLLDIGLPDVDGIEVARRLAADVGGPVVILISSRDVVYGRRVAHGVAAGYVPKDALSLAAVLEVFGPASTTGQVVGEADLAGEAVAGTSPGPPVRSGACSITPAEPSGCSGQGDPPGRG